MFYFIILFYFILFKDGVFTLIISKTSNMAALDLAECSFPSVVLHKTYTLHYTSLNTINAHDKIGTQIPVLLL